MRGEGVKNDQNLVHMVIEWPLVKKSILEGTLLADGFLPDSDLFYILAIRKGSLDFGTFVLG